MTSLSRIPKTSCANNSAVRIMLFCRCTAPLGLPVEPEEYSQKQTSLLKVVAALFALAIKWERDGASAGPFPETMMDPGQSAMRAASCTQESRESETIAALGCPSVRI